MGVMEEEEDKGVKLHDGIGKSSLHDAVCLKDTLPMEPTAAGPMFLTQGHVPDPDPAEHAALSAFNIAAAVLRSGCNQHGFK